MGDTLKRGFMVGLNVTWTLGKIIFPVTLIISLLQHTPVLPWIINLISPFMKLIGLPGDAAIPLVLGNFLNLYAGIGAILSLDFTVKEVFIIAIMLSFSHSMIMEASVAIKTGVKLWVVLLVRISLMLVAAVIVNLLWQGGSEPAQYGFISPQEEVVTGWLAILGVALQKAIMGIVQLALIVIPLMMGIQILKDKHWLEVFSKKMAPFTHLLGIKENTSTTLAAGLLFGLSYGAGVMVQAVKEDGVSKKDLTLAFIFLVSCHAVIEDTLIFIPLGIPVLPLLIIRLSVAIILTIIVATVWKRVELAKRKEAVYEH
jgi:hypothetical protein